MFGGSAQSQGSAAAQEWFFTIFWLKQQSVGYCHSVTYLYPLLKSGCQGERRSTPLQIHSSHPVPEPSSLFMVSFMKIEHL